MTVFSDVAASQQAFAMRLLGQAAAAGQATSYQGVEVTSQSGVDGTVTVVSQVWHQGGGLTLIRTSSGATPVVSYDTGDRSPAGVFGVTSAQVALLGKHYVAVYRGDRHIERHARQDYRGVPVRRLPGRAVLAGRADPGAAAARGLRHGRQAGQR